MKYVSLLACVALFLLNGCGPPPPPETPEQKEVRLQEFGVENLPTDAKKVVDLGNGWKTFELEIDGVKRKFLYRRASRNFGESRWAAESITEMSLAPLP